MRLAHTLTASGLCALPLAACATVGYLPPEDPVAARLAQCVNAAKQHSYSAQPGTSFVDLMNSFAAHWNGMLAERLPTELEQKQALAWAANSSSRSVPGGGFNSMVARGAAVGQCEQEFGRPASAEVSNG